MLAEDFMDSYNQRINSKLRTSLSMNCVNVNEKSNLVYLNATARNRPTGGKMTQSNFSSPEHVFKGVKDTVWSNSGSFGAGGRSSSCETGNELNSTSKQQIKRKNRRRIKYKFKRENMALYFAYEYVMFGLVLDRLFFWFYFLSTLLSYFITLYVFPFVVQTNKKDLSPNVP